MPRSKKEGWISWRGSEARAVLMKDLIDDILPVEASRITAEEAWEVYKTMDEFANVVFHNSRYAYEIIGSRLVKTKFVPQRSWMPSPRMTDTYFQGRRSINEAS